MGVPVALDVRPSEDKEVHDINQLHSRLAAGRLAPVPDGSIKQTTLRNSHWNAGARAILHGCPTGKPKLGVNVFLSLEHIRNKSREWAEHITDGIQWLVLDKDCPTIWPKFVELVIESGNCQATAVKSNDENDVMNRIIAKSSEMLRADGSPDWDAIANNVRKSNPPCSACIPAMCRYARARMAGLPPNLLAEHRAFIAKYCPGDGRQIHKELYTAMGEVVISKSEPCALFWLAVPKALLNAPAIPFVKHNVCTLLAPSEIQRLRGSLLKRVLEAEACLRQCFGMVTTLVFLLPRRSCDRPWHGAGARCLVGV